MNKPHICSLYAPQVYMLCLPSFHNLIVIFLKAMNPAVNDFNREMNAIKYESQNYLKIIMRKYETHLAEVTDKIVLLVLKGI